MVLKSVVVPLCLAGSIFGGMSPNVRDAWALPLPYLLPQIRTRIPATPTFVLPAVSTHPVPVAPAFVLPVVSTHPVPVAPAFVLPVVSTHPVPVAPAFVLPAVSTHPVPVAPAFVLPVVSTHPVPKGSIYGHKTLRRHTNTRLSLWEIPYRLRPQTRSNASVVSHRGLSYTHGFFPERKIFSSITLNYARHQHRPQESLNRPPHANDPKVLSSVRTRHADLVYNLHYQPKAQWISWYFGLGLGVFAGVVQYENGHFESRFEPYPALQMGLLLRVQSAILGLRVHQSSFIFGEGVVQSNQRLLAGMGWLF